MDKLTKEFAEYILDNIKQVFGNCSICNLGDDYYDGTLHTDTCIYRKAELFLELWELVNA